MFLKTNKNINWFEDCELCDKCYQNEYRWKTYGSFYAYCTNCWLKELQKEEPCARCDKIFQMGNLCYDGWNRYTYRCKECQQEYFNEHPNSVKSLYKEGLVTMFEEVENDIFEELK